MENWDNLRLFLAVARAGTLTLAADKLGMGVSTLHRHLAAFETTIGSKLFEKGPRGYRLTHAGEALLPRAEDVGEAVFAARRAVLGHDQQASGEVRITSPLVLVRVIAPHLAAFSRSCTRIRPILQGGDAELDLGRETDLAIRATTRPLDTAIGRKICGLAWGLYAPVDPTDDVLPWIHYVGMDHSPAIQWRKKAFPKNEPVMLVEGIMGMHSVLAATGAQGLLPCFVGDSDPTLRRMGDPIAMNELWVLVHADLRRSARVRALLDFLVPRLLADKALFEGTALVV